MRVWLYVLMLLTSLGSCQSSKEYDTAEHKKSFAVDFPDTSSLKDLSGEQLAHLYCQKCHLFPNPELLSKAHWEKGVLPRMGQRLGINTSLSLYAGLSYDEIQILSQAEIFPGEKKITKEAWQKLVAYYLSNAPDSMPPSERKVFADSLPLFTTEDIQFHDGAPSLTTLVYFELDALRLWIGNREGEIKRLNNKLHLIDTLQAGSPTVAMVTTDTAHYLLPVGLMDPSDKPLGKLIQLDDLHHKRLLLQNLHRPVHLSIADLNQDRVQDYIIANFGNYVGNLAWYDGNDLKEQVLDPYPGCVKTDIYDFNQDGLLDIMALMAQGDERIIIFYNKGEGNFQAKTVLRFPPVYGSSYFELADFNNDGKIDILYVNGDNADFSIAFKNYHGIRIFENQGDDYFEEAFFYPSYGTTMAKTADFDLDGDLDIALTAFFANFVDTPEKSFIYLENVSREKYNFRDYTIPQAKNGRWLTFDIGDIDEDGDQDIMLGAYISGPAQITEALQEEWVNSAPDVLILRNNKF